MKRGRNSNSESRQGRFLVGVATTLIVLSVAACSVASRSPSPEPAATAPASGEAVSPSPAPDTPAPSDSGAPTSPASSPTPSPLPSLGAVPAGTWTGFDWISLPAGHGPSLPAATDLAGPEVNLRGWSRGYVEIVWDPHLRTITPWVSGDGLTWNAGDNLDTTDWSAEFKAYDAQHSGPGDHDACYLSVSEFDEGGATLLMRAFFSCAGGCGEPWYTSQSAMWTSSDALGWIPVDVRGTFGAGGVGSISGGSSGFIALGSSMSSKILWLSADGRQWTNGTLPADLRKATSSVGSPASFAGGYVLPGVLLQKAGEEYSGGGAGCVAPEGPSNPPVYRAALWSSTDGKNWVRDSLTGTTDAASVTMSVIRVDDHTLIAVQNAYVPDVRGVTSAEWVSTDGKAWKPLEGVSPYATALTDGTRGLLIGCNDPANPAQDVWLNACAIGPNLQAVHLTESGEMPQSVDGQLALGPTGLLLTGDGTNFWIGVPR